MEQIVYVIVNLASIMLLAVQLLMTCRVLLSFILVDGDDNISNFLYHATEPVVYPLRLLFEKLGLFEDFVLDIPFLATYLILSILQTILPTVYL